MTMIYLGSDHGGYELKEKLKTWLAAWDIPWEDCGNAVLDAEDDYPQYSFLVAERTVTDPTHKGILACRSAGGVVVAANKVKGARAVNCVDVKSAQHARLHNNANILALSGDWLTEEQAQHIVRAFIDTEFSNEERHARRIQQIDAYERR